MTERIPTVYEQYLNVMEGYTADGAPRGGPVRAPGGHLNGPNMGLLLLVLFRDLEHHIPEEMKSDRMRTAAILVFVRWMKLNHITTSLRIKNLMRRVGAPAS